MSSLTFNRLRIPNDADIPWASPELRAFIHCQTDFHDDAMTRIEESSFAIIANRNGEIVGLAGISREFDQPILTYSSRIEPNAKRPGEAIILTSHEDVAIALVEKLRRVKITPFRLYLNSIACDLTDYIPGRLIRSVSHNIFDHIKDWSIVHSVAVDKVN